MKRKCLTAKCTVYQSTHWGVHFSRVELGKYIKLLKYLKEYKLHFKTSPKNILNAFFLQIKLLQTFKINL